MNAQYEKSEFQFLRLKSVGIKCFPQQCSAVATVLNVFFSALVLPLLKKKYKTGQKKDCVCRIFNFQNYKASLQTIFFSLLLFIGIILP